MVSDMNAATETVPEIKKMSVPDKIGFNGASIGAVIMEAGLHFKSGKAIAAGAVISLGSLALSALLQKRGRQQ